jgi:methionyl-tRNA formyltransferase
MRIEFLTQDDPLYILPFFEEFFIQYAKDFQITQVSCCRTMGSRPRSQLAQELFWLYGPLGFGHLVGRAALGQAFGLLRRRPGSGRYFSMRQVCRAYEIPLRHIGNPNHAEFVEGLRERNPDLLVSVACPYILKDHILKFPRLGCINIHHAPLPGYKGMMPTFWQMFHGERSVGVTVHSMAAKVDEGRILLQENLPIESGESLDSLIRRSKRHGAHCMARVLRQLTADNPPAVQPAERPSSYFTFPKREEIIEFHRRGFRAI